MRKLSVSAILLVVVLLHGGCAFISLLGTPSRHEKKVPAEYRLTQRRDEKLLVLVTEPAWLGAEVNWRYYLTEAINGELTRKIGISRDNLVGYSELSGFRSNRPDYSMLTPGDVGRAMDVNMVLLVTVEQSGITGLGQQGYCKGLLSARAVLIDVGSGAVLWPGSATGKQIRVGFEIEPRGREGAATRLGAAAAHCIVRYFYDCRKDKFKIGDDISEMDWHMTDDQMLLGGMK